MRGFEPPISGPPDQHFNRTKLHPDIVKFWRQIYYNLFLIYRDFAYLFEDTSGGNTFLESVFLDSDSTDLAEPQEAKNNTARRNTIFFIMFNLQNSVNLSNLLNCKDKKKDLQLPVSLYFKLLLLLGSNQGPSD